MKDISGILLALILFLFPVSQITVAQGRLVIRSKASPSSKKIIKYGLASYYAKKFHGRKTSNGAFYNSKKLSAACNVLPLGTWVRVTNWRNKKSIVLMINDRLHRRNKRLIDLSKFAAQRLGYIKRGITRVKVEVVSMPRKS